jgi:hypothetical protein
VKRARLFSMFALVLASCAGRQPPALSIAPSPPPRLSNPHLPHLLSVTLTQPALRIEGDDGAVVSFVPPPAFGFDRYGGAAGALDNLRETGLSGSFMVGGQFAIWWETSRGPVRRHRS